MSDFAIAAGTIIGGTGAQPYQGRVLIRGDHIAAVGPNIEIPPDIKIIEASGFTVCPGFIDTHSHSDFSLFFNPDAESALYQGVTTEVIGNCGLSIFPIADDTKNLLQSYIIGLGYDGSYPIDWTDLDGYAAAFEKNGVGINIAPLVGHGSIRIAVMGFEARQATPKELSDMKRLLKDALDQGVIGLSTGLIYPPGINSPSAELEELCAVAADHGAIYTTHLRGDALKAGPSLAESLGEALAIAQKSGVQLHVSHLAPKFPNSGTVQTIIEKLQTARDNGMNVTCDAHPYLAAMTFLAALLPPWIFEGGTGRTMERLTSPKDRSEVLQAVKASFNHLNPDEFWPLNEIVLPDETSEFNRLRMDVISRKMGLEPEEALVELLAQNGEKLFEVLVLPWIYSAEETLDLFRWPHTMVGADGATSSLRENFGSLTVHPRSWGTFPKMINDYCKKEKYFVLEELIRRMTGLPAQTMGLKDRGLIQAGKKADIVVFDLNQLNDTATFSNPHQYAEGMQYVWVNGRPVIDNGKRTHVRPGKVLRNS